MSKNTDKKEEMIVNAQKMTEIRDEDIEQIVVENTETVEEQENNERTDIDNIISENDLVEQEQSNIKIKEIKYGFSVLTNIGNFENIRTQIEVSAEIGENDNLQNVLDVLSTQVKDWGRKEYKDIKRRVK